MTTYLPATTVLDYYTDDALRAGRTAFAARVSAELLTIPAEYRQPCEAEVSQRSSRTIWKRTNDGLALAESELIDDPRRVRAEVIAEIRAQLAKAAA